MIYFNYNKAKQKYKKKYSMHTICEYPNCFNSAYNFVPCYFCNQISHYYCDYHDLNIIRFVCDGSNCLERMKIFPEFDFEYAIWTDDD